MPFSQKHVEDLETLKAVAHPLRVVLLGMLRNEGPATASELARRTGESSGSTSYHLRQLERYGFVRDDDEQPSGRERRWRATHDVTTIRDTMPGAEPLLEVLRERQVTVLRAGLAELGRLDPKPDGLGMSDLRLALDEADLVTLRDELVAVVERYADRRGSREVAVHLAITPAVQVEP